MLVMGLILLAGACGSEPPPTVAPTSAPTAAPTPTPTPELTLDSVLSSAGQGLAEMSTAKFQMIDELESGSQFFGMTLKNVEGEIKSPDSFRMLVNVETPNFGFVAIENDGGRGTGIHEVLQRRALGPTAFRAGAL